MRFNPKRLLISTVLCSTVGVGLLFSQENKRLTLDDVIAGGKGFARHTPKTLQVAAITSAGLIHTKDNEYRLIEKVGGERTFLTLSAWREVMCDDKAKLPYLMVDKLTGQLIALTGKGLYLLDNISGKIAGEYLFDTERFKTFDLSIPGGRIALMDGHNIYVSDRMGYLAQVTADGTDDIVYGEVAHRNEFGTSKGTLWSPSGRYLAFFRVDHTEVEAYPLVDMNAPIARLMHYKYPMAGRKSEKVTVHIYDTQDNTVQTIDTGEPLDSYLTNWSWSPEEAFCIEHVSRNQKQGKLVRYNAKSGKPLHTILKEESPFYVEPSTPIQYIGTSRAFVRASRVAGYNHLFLIGNDGKSSKQLTSGVWEVKQFVGIDAKGNWAYYISNEGYPMGQSLWRVSLRSAKRECLTPEKGFHSVTVAPDLSYAVDNFSNIDNPGELRFISLGRKPQTRTIATATVSLTEFDLPKVELGTIKAADGTTDLYYKMTSPRTLEPGKKYPAIVYVYGGPHAQLVTDSWRSLHQTWDNYMAQEGYIVFTVDSRGSANRGLAFEAAIHRNLGIAEMADQMKGVEYLKSLPYVDADRIGVHGWSYGGFLTTNLMLTHPETFKVGVAGGPVMDWSFYEVMYGERYMGTPQDNPEGYKASNLIDRAGDLRGRLMLIHGDIDPVVVWQHSLLFLKSAVAKGTMPDYMIYPGHEHNVRGVERVHLYKVITRYFTDHL